MRHFHGISEWAQAVGQEIGISPWRTITQQDINTFAQVTDDHQWIHTDVERARSEGPYGGPIVHGYLTLALAPAFMREVYNIHGLKMGVNYGSNKVRFPAPVLAGGEVRGRIELLSVAPAASGVESIIKLTIEQQERDGVVPKPACVAEIVSRLYE